MRSIMKTKRLGELSRVAMLKASTWLRQEKGSLNVLYALALIPMIGALGLATDTARGYPAEGAPVAVDRPGGPRRRQGLLSRRERNADVLKYFSANFPNTAAIAFDAPFQADFMDARSDAAIRRLTAASAGSETLAYSATATIPTTFMRVLNAVGCTGMQRNDGVFRNPRWSAPSARWMR